MLELVVLIVIGFLVVYLELEELVVEVVVDDIVKCEMFFCVVLFDEVLVDGFWFLKGEIGVGVFDGWDVVVGVDVYERGFFYVIEVEWFEYVVKGEFFKEENGFLVIGVWC